MLVATVSGGGGTVTKLPGASGIVDGLQSGYQTASGFNVSDTLHDFNGNLYYVIQPSATSFVPYYLGQTTQYVYGTTATSPTPDIYRNDVVTAVIYPDSTNSDDRVQYTFDRQGEMNSMEDQNQTTHDYAYDGVGRLLSDTVVSFGAIVNPNAQYINSIQYAYKVCGKLLSVSSYHDFSASEPSEGSIANQVSYQYDTNGNLVERVSGAQRRGAIVAEPVRGLRLR